ncbi:GSCOCG00000520001-RA-CDS [Cotesia congregata]|nr:GSCOCG00000520001-RA-CDS [Cotesia congregata]
MSFRYRLVSPIIESTGFVLSKRFRSRIINVHSLTVIIVVPRFLHLIFFFNCQRFRAC